MTLVGSLVFLAVAIYSKTVALGAVFKRCCAVTMDCVDIAVHGLAWDWADIL